MSTGLGALYEHYSSKWPHSLPDSLIPQELARAAFRKEESEVCAFLGHTSVREDKPACKRLSLHPASPALLTARNPSSNSTSPQVLTATPHYTGCPKGDKGDKGKDPMQNSNLVFLHLVCGCRFF